MGGNVNFFRRSTGGGQKAAQHPKAGLDARNIQQLEKSGAESGEDDQRRWRWHEVSLRRVVGTLLRGFGLIGVAFGVAHSVLGRWDPDLDPAFLAASVVMLLASVPVLWRVKPAHSP